MAAAKIDLKARLGKKSLAPSPGVPPTGAAPAGPVPGSMAPGPGVPAPIASRPPTANPGVPTGPGPGVPGPGAPSAVGSGPAAMSPQRPIGGSSIPAPPGFGAPPQQASRPAAAPAAAPPAARPGQPAVAARPVGSPQGIRLDMGEEVVAAQKASKAKARIMALIAAGVALVIGFGVGSLAKGNEGAQAAVEGAGLLVQEIGTANEKATEMNELLKSAAKKVKGGEFPADEVEKLGAIDIPFDGSNLTNKGIGRFNPTAMTLLLQYSTAVQNAEDQKDKLRRLLGGLKSHFETVKAEKESPMFHWGVKLESTPMGPIGKMSLIKPVAIQDKKDSRYRWPKEIEFGKSKLSRYEGGDPKGESYMIPVDPDSEAMVCPENIAIRVMGALIDASKELEGDETPGREQAGVIALGNKAMEQLKKIGSGA